MELVILLVPQRNVCNLFQIYVIMMSVLHNCLLNMIKVKRLLKFLSIEIAFLICRRIYVDEIGSYLLLIPIIFRYKMYC